MQVINLPGVGQGNPYETLHAYIHNAVAPFFDAYASARGGLAGAGGAGGATAGDKEAKTGECFCDSRKGEHGVQAS